MKQRSLKVNSILNIIKTCSSVLFPLITYPYISRVLQPTNIGKVNFGSSFVSYFSLIASLGISTYAIRECSKKREDRKELSNISSQIFSINIYTTIIAYILLAISLIFFRTLDSYRTLIIIQSTAILFTTVGVDYINTAMEDFTYITIRTIAFQILSLVLTFLLVKSPEDYVKYATISVISSSGANLLNAFYVKKYCDVKFTNNIDWELHLKPIMLLFVMLLAQQIFNNIDITMLGLMKGDYEVGLYTTATKATNVITQTGAAITWVFMPQLAIHFQNSNETELNAVVRKMYNAYMTLILPCLVGAMSIARQIILIIGGSEYLGATSCLQLLLLGQVISSTSGFIGNLILLPSGREKDNLIGCIIIALIDLVANYFIIPAYGAAGASFTTMASLIVSIPLNIYFCDKRVDLKQFKYEVIKPAVGCLVIIVICYICNKLIPSLLPNTIISILLSIIGYFAVQIIMKNTLVISTITSIKNKIRRVS